MDEMVVIKIPANAEAFNPSIRIQTLCVKSHNCVAFRFAAFSNISSSEAEAIPISPTRIASIECFCNSQVPNARLTIENL